MNGENVTSGSAGGFRNPTEAAEDENNSWYDAEHINNRLNPSWTRVGTALMEKMSKNSLNQVY